MSAGAEPMRSVFSQAGMGCWVSGLARPMETQVDNVLVMVEPGNRLRSNTYQTVL